MIYQVFFLLVVFQLKHFVADYVLQSEFMLGKFKKGWSFAPPLFAHASVHSAFTLAVCLWFAPNLYWLAIVDLVTHFIIDRLKAGPKYLGRFKLLSPKQFKVASTMAKTKWADREKAFKEVYTSANVNDLKQIYYGLKKARKAELRHNVYFWMSIGFDQMLHHLVHYYIIFAIVVETTL